MTFIRQFQKQETNQAQSQLLIPPAEIRVKILRNLLRSENGRVRNRRELCSAELTLLDYDFGGEEEVDQQDFQRCKDYWREHGPGGAQVLRTCQRMYLEGTETLYKEQTIDILVEDDNLIAVAFSMLDQTITLSSYERPCEEYFSTSDVQECHDTIRPNNLRRLLHAYKVPLKQFKNVQVQINEQRLNATEICFVGRALRGIMQDKNATIFVNKLATRQLICEDWFNGFKVLRCKTVSFKGVSPPAGLVELIQSSETQFDTYAAWFNFHQNFLDNLPVQHVEDEEYGTSFSDDAIDHLVDLAITYDKKKF